MQIKNATQVRKTWSETLDDVSREKPIIIKRTRDSVFMSNLMVIDELLSKYSFHAQIYTEDNGSFTISLDEIDLAENDVTKNEVILKLASSILEYAEDFYDNFSYWARGNRKAHIPYVLKALLIGDIEQIGGLIECRHGKI